MPYVPDLQSLLRAAEQAAAAGEHASAERHLREAAALQEAHLGPLHPDLARTLNNLAVACEMADNPVDAEHYFRRAYVTARSVLDGDHPFVATSRRNLEEFCAARGKPVELPGRASSVVAPAAALKPAARHAPARTRRTTNEPTEPHRSGRSTRVVVTVVVAASLLLTLAVATWIRSGQPTGAAPSPVVSAERQATASESPTVPGMTSIPPAAAVDPMSADELPERAHAATAATAGRTLDAESSSTTASAPNAPIVTTAELCRTLSTGNRAWRCIPAAPPLEPGALFFYTRLKSPRGMVVQHRWYRNDRVQKVVRLSIRSNVGEGYRTYSRYRVGADDAGEWKVELTADGAVLHEERFVVR